MGTRYQKSSGADPSEKMDNLQLLMRTPPVKKNGACSVFLQAPFSRGEGGIRTHDELLTHTPLAGERLQPTRPPLQITTNCAIFKKHGKDKPIMRLNQANFLFSMHGAWGEERRMNADFGVRNAEVFFATDEPDSHG